MLTRRRLFDVAAVALLVLFCAGLLKLLMLRFSAGDVFPPYSSLRADPLGAQILYESLRELPDRAVARNELPLDRLGTGESATLLFLGLTEEMLSLKEQRALEQFVQTGGRLVLAFHPQNHDENSPTPSATPDPAPKADADPQRTAPLIKLTEMLSQWDVKVHFRKQTDLDEDSVATNRSALQLENDLSWHSGVWFEPQNEGWRTVYDYVGVPVIVERSFKAGTVVLVGDCYLLSNEALLVERTPSLLAWLIGPHRQVIFDESHLNIREEPGVATLLRRYGLTGFVAGLFVLLALWLWRNTTFALSRRPRLQSAEEILGGRESFGGFVNLLRRGIAQPQLLNVCLSEWKKSAATVADNKVQSAEAILAAGDSGRNPVTVYNNINELLSRKKWKRTN